MAPKDFFKGTLKIALAVFLALVGLAAVVAGYETFQRAHKEAEAKPFEEVRNWSTDLKEQLGMLVTARTKLVGGRLLASIDIEGHPVLLDDPRNRDGSLSFVFLDKDGFELHQKNIRVSEFTTVVGEGGTKKGIRHQYQENLEIGEYQQFSQLRVGWALITKPELGAAAEKPKLDHCAPNLSKSERLKRLAQHGTVRQMGEGRYQVGNRSVNIFEYDGTLISCE